MGRGERVRVGVRRCELVLLSGRARAERGTSRLRDVQKNKTPNNFSEWRGLAWPGLGGAGWLLKTIKKITERHEMLRRNIPGRTKYSGYTL